MLAAILALEKDQMLPETEPEQEITCAQQQGEVWFSWNWKTGYCGQELIYFRHPSIQNPFWHRAHT